jgi:hypothetical protein
VTYWEIIADDLSKPVGRGAACQRWLARGARSGSQTPHRDGKRFVVRADEKLTAFIELESSTSEIAQSDGMVVTARFTA